MADNEPVGPDLAAGLPLADLKDGAMLQGHVGGEPVLLVRQSGKLHALDAFCTHYHGTLADGLLAGGTVRCPLHHACFDLATGEALHAPAIDPLSCWPVEEHDGKVFVGAKRLPRPDKAKPSKQPEKIVILGGGAAGFAAAEKLRRDGYSNNLVMVSADEARPIDRPNLSKDYLAGNAPEEWMPLRPDEFYGDNGIDLKLNAEAVEIDRVKKEVRFADGTTLSYDKLLLATGAEPVQLTLPGADPKRVKTLRTLSDCRAIIGQLEGVKRVAVVGASFIGLEVAASLRAREIEVHVIAPEKIPMAKILGPEMGSFIRALHEERGVIFHLGETATAMSGTRLTLQGGGTIDADLVIAGIGVRPRLTLAEAAGLTLDRGVTVNEFLETSDPDILAAGDIARWPDPHTGDAIRVEHWVVAERQGQHAAGTMLGNRKPFIAVPFFWSQHYDMAVNYIGHAENWDAIEIEGDIAKRDCLLRYKRGGKVIAVASIGRDRQSLEAELKMERELA
jgi:NADPH-dependent 2,4-dienoyl-CoA reductase/sulfur reductase-like enzyme/nitrite reductase/ring-hydroxylating ferredoxin subunit